MAELSKLLTFMYEEDRRYALDMYERMFDIAEGNEQWLLQNLMSPTRQAVIIARSYNAKNRSLTVAPRWKEEDGYEDEDEETPPFVKTINKVFDDLFPDEAAEQEALEDQFSLFDHNGEREKQKNRMPKAAILLNRTREFRALTEEDAVTGADDLLPEGEQEDFRTEASGNAPDERDEETADGRAEEDNASERQPEETPSSASGKQHTADEKKEAGGEEESATASVALQPDDAPAPPAKARKRRSIEDLLGLRREKSKAGTENAPQTETASETMIAGEEPDEPDRQAGEASAASELVPEAVTEAAEETQTEISAGAASTLPEKDTAESLTATSAEEDPETAAAELPQEKTATETAKRGIKQVPIVEAENHGSKESATGTEGADPLPGNAKNAESEQHETAEEKLPLQLPEEDAPVIRKPELRRQSAKRTATKREANFLLLVPFLILAIPATACLLVLLALAAALCLSLSFGTIALGAVLVISAFSGFAVLADILLLLGGALISLALGLLFLWLTLWIIGEVMVSLANAVRELALQWCYKEVPEA